ncbi:MAG: Rib/alpha-like domain-containing protein, partial [Bowdeniella nasicola]|nr:Rib/alpha-like domain-containing protein [Bowdeniella nasicola]
FDPKPKPVEVEVGGTVDPEGAIENLDELPEGTTVTIPGEVDTSKPGTQTVEVEVVYPDGSKDTVEVEITVTDSRTDADKFDPKPKPVEVGVGETVDPNEAIGNLDELPDGTTVTISPVDTSKPGTQDVTVTVTYPDGSTDTFTTTVTVKAATTTPDPGEPGRELPITGAQAGVLGTLSLLTMLAGVAIVGYTRRRQAS